MSSRLKGPRAQRGAIGGTKLISEQESLPVEHMECLGAFPTRTCFCARKSWNLSL